MATILITGGTGLIGKALTGMLIHRGHRIIILTRSGERSSGQVSYLSWNVAAGKFPPSAVAETDYVVHLAGANVGSRRWSARRREEIVRSRTDGSALLTEALKIHPNRVQTVVSASALGYYGPDKDRPFRESDPPAGDFLGETCRLWEASLAPLRQLGKRLVILRTGIVLATEGGVFPALKGPLRAGIGAIPGSGKQIISWIHLVDICRMYMQALEDPSVDGVYNAAAPEPVPYKTLVLSLALRLRGKFFIPIHVPAPFLKIALGDMSVEVLKSCTVDTRKIREAGFQCVYPQVEAALEDLTSKG